MPERIRLRLALVVAGQFAALAALAALSDGIRHEDSLTHFLLARGAWVAPANFLDAWGRPGCTALLATVAWIGSPETGFLLARLLNAALAAGCTALTVRAVRLLDLAGPDRAALLLVSQPLFLALGCATLTEMPCAFYLAAALVTALSGRPVLSAGLLSLSFATRHECVILLAVWLLWWLGEVRRGRLSRRRLFLALVTAAWAPVLVNIAGIAIAGKAPWSVFLDPTPEAGTAYGRGLLTTMAVYWMVAAGPLLALAVPFGVVGLARRRGFAPVAGTFLAYLAVHCLVLAFGLFASGGYPRFMVVVAVPSALLGLCGLRVLAGAAQRGDGRVAWLLLGLFAALAVAADVEIGRFVRLNPLASSHWPLGRWILRAVLAGATVVFVGRCMIGRKGWAAFTLRAMLGGAVLLQLANLAMFVQLPVRRTEHQVQLVRAAHRIAEEYPGRIVFGASPWVSFALDVPWRSDVEHPWERFEAAAPGALYLCDVIAGDYRLAQGARPIAFYERSPGFRRLPLPGADRGKIALFEKR